MKIAMYIRVSTRDKQDITKQRDYLIDYINRQENKEIYKIYADRGISGSKQNRPGLDEMLADINEWDAVLVYKIDRIGRSFKHLFNLMDLFKKRKKEFISATQPFDTTTPEGKLFFNQMAAFAEFEREMIVMRIRDGLAEAKKRGVKLGRKKGSKDRKKRNRIGYFKRWEKERNQVKPPSSEIEKQMYKAEEHNKMKEAYERERSVIESVIKRLK